MGGQTDKIQNGNRSVTDCQGRKSKTSVLTLFSNNCNSQERCAFFWLVQEAPGGPPSPSFSSGWGRVSWFSDGGGVVGQENEERREFS